MGTVGLAGLALRQLADDDYGTQVEIERVRAGATRVTHEPRYRALAAVAHGLAAAGNAGKVAVTGNPLGINVVQWSRAAPAISHHLQVDAPGDTLVGQAAANRHAIDLGWAKLGWSDLPTVDL